MCAQVFANLGQRVKGMVAHAMVMNEWLGIGDCFRAVVHLILDLRSRGQENY
jgi:hypothetical protein